MYAETCVCVMRIQRMVCFKINFVISLILCVTPSIIKAQEQGCFLQGINLDPCRDLTNNFVSDSCCNALNQALQIGMYCFCLLISSSSPFFNLPFSVPLANCFISVPPLTQCLAPKPELRPSISPVPLPMSPPIPKELPQPPRPKIIPPPPVEVVVPLNSTSKNNTTTEVLGPPPPSGEDAPVLSMSSRGNVTSHCGHKIKILLHIKTLLAITLLACML